MAGQKFMFEDLKPFLRHEIGSMERLDEDRRKMTVMYFHLNETAERVTEVLKDALREADVIFKKGDEFFIVLPLTDKEGAMYVARLLERYFGHKVKDVATTWPEDGDTAEEILASLIEYVKSIHNIDLKPILG